MTTLAVLGTGIMGAPMARNCARAGLAVRAWNRTSEKARALERDGVTACDSPEEAAAGCDIVMTMLADAEAVLGVAEDALPATQGAVWWQAATIGLEGIERCARLAERHRATLVDAPVLGTRQPAEDGALIVLASGPEEALERCAPGFAAVARRTLRLGAAGAGTRLKLCVNSWVFSVLEGIAETIALAEGLGVDPARIFDALEGGPMDSPYARAKAALIADGDFPPSFALALAAMDARLVVEAAARHDLDLPLARAIADRFAAGVAAGHGGEDMAATYRLSAPPT